MIDYFKLFILDENILAGEESRRLSIDGGTSLQLKQIQTNNEGGSMLESQYSINSNSSIQTIVTCDNSIMLSPSKTPPPLSAGTMLTPQCITTNGTGNTVNINADHSNAANNGDGSTQSSNIHNYNANYNNNILNNCNNNTSENLVATNYATALGTVEAAVAAPLPTIQTAASSTGVILTMPSLASATPSSVNNINCRIDKNDINGSNTNLNNADNINTNHLNMHNNFNPVSGLNNNNALIMNSNNNINYVGNSISNMNSTNNGIGHMNTVVFAVEALSGLRHPSDSVNSLLEHIAPASLGSEGVLNISDVADLLHPQHAIITGI